MIVAARSHPGACDVLEYLLYLIAVGLVISNVKMWAEIGETPAPRARAFRAAALKVASRRALPGRRTQDALVTGGGRIAPAAYRHIR